MAEGRNEKKGYFTRSRKRSLDNQDNKQDTIDLSKDENDMKSFVEGDTKDLECAICLQTCVHPARLPCGHIFCFLCVKGAAHGNKKCAMCRTPIPHNYFNNPELLKTPEEVVEGHHEGYEWFYEGRHGGWWQYEERMSNEIEEAYKSGVDRFEMLICGSMYTIDLRSLTQYRTDAPWQIRQILRKEPSSVDKRGVAGWWQYDSRATVEIESAWKEGVGQCELLIAGYLYIIDFVEMYQIRKGQISKRRKIKRDYATSEKLGIAGLRDPNAPPRRLSEGDKGRQENESYDRNTPRRASLGSSRSHIDFLEEQFADLSLNNSDDEDGYHVLL